MSQGPGDIGVMLTILVVWEDREEGRVEIHICGGNVNVWFTVHVQLGDRVQGPELFELIT